MKKILHIDSSEFFRRAFKDLFTANSFEYIGVKTFSESYNILNNESIDMIFVAISIEEETIEFIKELNNGKNRNIPVFVLSSNDTIEEKERMFNLGIIDYIPKTSSPKEILNYALNFIKKIELMEESKEMRVAVLDDSQLILDIIKGIFESVDINKVDFFKTGEELFEKNISYDCYIIDIVLKETSGKKIISKIRETNENAVIIAISSISNYKTISNILYEGADDYLIKPFDRGVFLARLRTNFRGYLLRKQLEETNETLAKMVITDGLTGLFNHKYVFERLEVEMKEANRYNRKLSILMLDIDHFKRVNDTYGHQAGDTVLLEVAKILKSSVRDIDIVGRYGGEEFLIILPETDKTNSIVVAERIRENVEKLILDYEKLKVTISCGICEYDGQNEVQFIEEADELLYKAKKNGRNRIET